jgi:hypothetical protein
VLLDEPFAKKPESQQSPPTSTKMHFQPIPLVDPEDDQPQVVPIVPQIQGKFARRFCAVLVLMLLFMVAIHAHDVEIAKLKTKLGAQRNSFANELNSFRDLLLGNKTVAEDTEEVEANLFLRVLKLEPQLSWKCFAFRSFGMCTKERFRNADLDRICEEIVPPMATGHCECGLDEQGRRVRVRLDCFHGVVTCADVCERGKLVSPAIADPSWLVPISGQFKFPVPHKF